MKAKRWMAAGLAACAMAMPAMAGNDEAPAKEETKKGSPVITIFSDFHTGFGNVNDNRGFDLDRAYIGYQYKLTKELQIRAVMDFGQSDDVNDYQRIGYIKNAQITWKRDGWTLNAGLTSTTQFKLQEDFWGKRYVMKSFQDEYKFGSSADLAVTVAYRFNKYVSADVILANGEGYKKVQVKDGLQYGAGVTVTPAEGFVIRAYGSYNEAPESSLEGITNVAAFMGYKNRSFSVAAEYNWQSNAKNVKGNDQSGVSAYASVQFNKCMGLFGRWDMLMSKHDWNEESDGMAGVLGAEFKLGKYIKLAPNFRVWSPKAKGADESGYFYLNASFVL